MRVTVEVFAYLRLRLGQKSIFLDLEDGSDLHEVVRCIGDLYGREVKDLIVTGDGQGFNVVFLVNGHGALPEQRLKDGDVVSIHPPIGGG